MWRDAPARSRVLTLMIATATLTSNVLLSVLVHHLPDDQFSMASNYALYLHFANILSVFGIVGALKKHALSVSLYSNYLLVDTLLSALPRFFILSLMSSLIPLLCSSPSSSSQRAVSAPLPTPNRFTLPNTEGLLPELGQDCAEVVTLAQSTLGACVAAATILQFAGGLVVRDFAKRLAMDEQAGSRFRLIEDVEVGTTWDSKE